MGEPPAIVGCHFLVEKVTFPSVDVLMPQLDFFTRNAVVEQVQKSGGRIFAATETYDVSVVILDVELCHFVCLVLSETIL